MKIKSKKISILIDLCIIIMPIIIISGFIYVKQDQYLYNTNYSNQNRMDIDSSLDEHLEEIIIETNNDNLYGWGYQISKDAPTLLYFGGNYESSNNFFYSLIKQGKYNYIEGYNIVMIDYPGYGISEGKPSYQNILQMASETYKYIDQSSIYGNSKIVVMGYSLGTGVATYIASNYEVDGLILLAPYTTGIDLYNSQMNIFYGPIKLLVKNKYPSITWSKEVKCDTLVVASKDDEVIPYQLSTQLAESLDSSTIVTLEGVSHNDLFSNQETFNQVKEYLNNKGV